MEVKNMPWGDGTGPYGTGPIGWGMGPCGRGIRRRFWACRPFWVDPLRTSDIEFLKREKEVLEKEIEMIDKRLKELEKKI